MHVQVPQAISHPSLHAVSCHIFAPQYIRKIAILGRALGPASARFLENLHALKSGMTQRYATLR